MHRIGIVVLCLIMVLVLGSVAGFSEQTENVMCVPMDTIVLEPPESVESQRASVGFPHSRHFIYDCKQCHHKWGGDAQIQDCTASGCHDLQKSPFKTKEGKPAEELAIKYYKTAFHKQCIGCHKEMTIKNKEIEMSHKILKTQLPQTGPTGCVECHLEQE